MRAIELPHTTGCLVCGRENPHGLHLSSWVELDTGFVETVFTPTAHHIGFENIIHGGILATVADEAMVWSAIWGSKKACVAAELSLRFVSKAIPDRPLRIVSKIARKRSRLIESSCEIHEFDRLICTASGKYVPLGLSQTTAFFKTFASDPKTAESEAMLRSGLA